jgi:arylsulfatase A-like enzyme
MRDVLRIAAWFGLLTGLVEGVAFLVFQRLGWLEWNRAFVPVAWEILWVAPFVDLLLFSSLGVALVVVGRFFHNASMPRFAFLVCAFCAFYDWIALSGRLYHYSVAALALGLAVVVTRWVWRHEATALRWMRGTLPALAAVALLALVGVQGGQRGQERMATTRLPSAAAGAPNVLVIVVDTLRADHLSTYGYARATSPNLDRLAQQGVLFENAISTSSWTLPSHASLVTGRYPHEHGAERGRLDARFTTIAEALLARGYRTGAFSANVVFFNRAQGFGRGFLHFEDYFQTVGDALIRTLYGREAKKYLLPYAPFEDIVGRRSAADINRSALRWIERDTTRPFFAFLNYFDTHDPHVPEQPYRRKFSTQEHPGGILNDDIRREDPDLTPAQLQGEIDAYDGSVAYTDEHIGRLLAALRQWGLLQNTFVFVTSDHGESLGDHNLFLHRNALYRELIHVPLIIVRPGVVPAGWRIAQPVTNAALPATIMTLVGADGAAEFPQRSLTRSWTADSDRSDWPAPIAELARFRWGPPRRPSTHGATKSVVTSDWHYIIHEKFGVQLYDWKHDPEELRNLAQQAALQSIVTRLGTEVPAFVSQKRPAAVPERAVASAPTG